MRILTPYYWPTRRMTSNFFNEMDRMFETAEPLFNPAHEATESEDHYLLSMDLPGFKKDNLTIELDGTTLNISGERKRDGNVIATFARSFTLPKTVDGSKIEAHHEDGVLSLYLPKTPVAKATKIEIQSQKGGFFDTLLGSKPSAVEDNKSNPSH